MNNSTSNNISAATLDIIIQEQYEVYVLNIVITSAVALLLYATILNILQEIEYMYLRRFSLPTLLYVFTRYGSLITEGLNLGVNLVPISIRSKTGATRTCNILANTGTPLHLMTYIGLLTARAYSLCQGNKFLTVVLAFGFLAGLILQLVGIIKFHANECVISPPASGYNLTALLVSIVTIITDLTVFGICMWKIWGTWKLKREVGIQGSNDLVSILLKQSILRCCFVVIITVIFTVMIQVANNNFVVVVSNAFQNSGSAILIAEFTLDLRRRNSTKIEANNVSLPTLQFRSVLEHVHRSFLVEMGTPEDIDLGEDGDHDVEPGQDQVTIPAVNSA